MTSAEIANIGRRHSARAMRGHVMPLHVVSIDDSQMNRDGVRLGIQRCVPDAIIEEESSFEDAMRRGPDGWAGVDYVVLDLSTPYDDDPTALEYPAYEVTRYIRRTAPGRGPYIVVITGERGARTRAVARCLREAGADYFLKRGNFEELLDQVFSPEGLPRSMHLEEEDGLDEPIPGVHKYSRLLDAAFAIQRSNILQSKPKGARGERERTRIQAIGNLKAVTASGEPDGGTVHRLQVEDTYQAVGRIPRPGEEIVPSSRRWRRRK